MAKSSSSHRKKRDKISSKARTKKTKSKSEKYRSKKVRRRIDSLLDEDDSKRLSSDSVFSSEDDRRSRRDRSRTRRDGKGSKKRSRKRSYSSEESPRPSAKKRKSSKKYEAKKREKPRRNARTSSVSSESRSCSTCQGGGTSGDEIESKKYRGRPEKRMREERDRKKVESGTDRSRYRSRSCSLRRNYSESDGQSEERATCEGNGRKLRSVIAVPEEDSEGRWLDEGGQKEEIAYDDDDYPSCRSNDSNDGGIKRELGNQLQVASEVRMRVESAKEEEALASDAEIMHLRGSGNICDRDGGDQTEGFDSGRDGTRITEHVNGNKISGEVSSLKDEDLETVLRQKAIENLKRFRGKPKEIAVTGDTEDKEQLSSAKAESVQIESPKVGGARDVVVKSLKEDISENDQTRFVEETHGSPARDCISSSEIFETELIKKNDRDKTISAKQDDARTTHREAVSGSSKMVSTIVVDKPNLAAPKIMFGSVKPQSILKRALASLQPPQDRLLVSESSVDNTASRTAKTLTQSSINDDLEIRNGSGSTDPEPSGENRSDSQQDEAKDGSQFEQKTMSVMRGSEMVQVSYKVYIPKKAPALARRQLKR